MVALDIGVVRAFLDIWFWVGRQFGIGNERRNLIRAKCLAWALPFAHPSFHSMIQILVPPLGNVHVRAVVGGT